MYWKLEYPPNEYRFVSIILSFRLIHNLYYFELLNCLTYLHYDESLQIYFVNVLDILGFSGISDFHRNFLYLVCTAFWYFCLIANIVILIFEYRSFCPPPPPTTTTINNFYNKDKCFDRVRKLKKLWNMSMTVISIVVGILGIIIDSERIEKYGLRNYACK